jgi:hypothetical protein
MINSDAFLGIYSYIVNSKVELMLLIIYGMLNFVV